MSVKLWSNHNSAPWILLNTLRPPVTPSDPLGPIWTHLDPSNQKFQIRKRQQTTEIWYPMRLR